jgi:hypothetical protein
MAEGILVAVVFVVRYRFLYVMRMHSTVVSALIGLLDPVTLLSKLSSVSDHSLGVHGTKLKFLYVGAGVAQSV